MQDVDAIIFPEWIAPVVPHGVVYHDYALAYDRGKIVACCPAQEARDRYSGGVILERPGHLLIPGLVNAHTHAAMTLLRGIADDLPLMDWLDKHVWPAERQWISRDFVRDGTTIAVAEMLAGGTTCCNDMYFFPDIAAQTASDLGMRFCTGIILLDGPSQWAADIEEYLVKGLEMRDRFKGNPLIHTIFAPHSPYTVGDAALLRIRKLADELDTTVHMHVHETSSEIEQSLARFGKRPIARLDELGLISPELLAVHLTQVTPEEMTLLAESGAQVVHCPESNMKLASGFCPVSELMSAGINVALGTDGAASNNDLCMIGEMRTASLLAKAVAGRADALSAHETLRMATLSGARAIGLEEQIGSLEPGKWADIVSIDLGMLNTQPVYDPVSQLVYAAQRDAVRDVWVAGRHLVAGGRLTQTDTDELYEVASRWRERLAPFSRHPETISGD
ncbi:MAG: TRZ/ATZ family hydrolase [Gammaproteobacteria bacterium]